MDEWRDLKLSFEAAPLPFLPRPTSLLTLLVAPYSALVPFFFVVYVPLVSLTEARAS